MSLARRSICKQGGCSRMCEGSYCEAHAKERKAKAFTHRATPVTDEQLSAQRERAAFYHTARWKRLRKMKLRSNPICEMDQCLSLAEEVDHKLPISEGGATLDLNNLQSLCHRCHTRKTAREIRARQLRNSKR